MKDMERGLPLSYLSAKVLPSSCRIACQSAVSIFLFLRLSQNRAFCLHRTGEKVRLPSQLWTKQKNEAVVFDVCIRPQNFHLFVTLQSFMQHQLRH